MIIVPGAGSPPRPSTRVGLACAIAGLLCGAIRSPAGAQPAAPPTVRYAVEYRPHEDGASLAVSLSAALDPAGAEVGLYLPDWGEWAEVDSLYLRGFRSDPSARRHPESPERWIVDAPDGWDGAIEVSYTIPLIDLDSRAAERHGLLPWEVRRPGSPAYAAATSRNTLMMVTRAGEALPAEVRITAPPGHVVLTGWAGLSSGSQTVAADLTEDSPLLFGLSPRRASGDAAGVTCEVFQLSAGPDVTAELLGLASGVADAYARTTGLPLRRPLRVFVTDKGGGQRVDRGLWMQAASEGSEGSPYYKHLLAHELFHEWLGGMARSADASTTWFQEGFTDYLSLWHLVAAGHATPGWFAQRMGELNEAARASAAYGRVAFGDPGADWRDWDGPNETLAYKGGAVLAFALDVELRRVGGPLLPTLVADLARTGEEYTLDAIHAWLASHGAGGFYDAYIAAPALPDWPTLVEAAGFTIAEREAPLTYTGLRSAGDTYLGEILAIDPEGPAAALGLRVGEHITGLWPSRSPRPRIGAGVTTEYRFGLDLAGVDAGPINIGVRGPGGDRTVQLTPRPLPGGAFEAVVPGPDAGAFFELR